MSADDSNNDSFERALATMEMPSDQKRPRLTSVSNLPATSIEAASSTSLPHNNIQPPMKTLPTSQYHISVHPKQRGNPILKSITNVPWEFDDIIPDYIVGPTTCVLFLSLKYHSLNPDYIHNRLKALGKRFELRVLLVQVDTKVCDSTLFSDILITVTNWFAGTSQCPETSNTNVLFGRSDFNAGLEFWRSWENDRNV